MESSNNGAEAEDAEPATYHTKESLLELVEVLHLENTSLRRQVEAGKLGGGRQDTKVKVEPIFRTFHRIGPNIFLRDPSWSNTGHGDFVLEGRLPVKSLDEYLARHENVAFVAFKDYTVGMRLPETTQDREDGSLSSPQPWKEAVKLTAPAMIKAMSDFLSHIPGFKNLLPNFNPTQEIHEPYMFWYCSRPHVAAALDLLPDFQRILIELFQDWVENTYGDEWNFVNTEFAKGVVSPLSVKYLVKPGDVLISREDGVVDGHIATTWTSFVDFPPDMTRGFRLKGRAKTLNDVLQETNIQQNNVEQPPSNQKYRWAVDSWAWSFDGGFRKAEKSLTLDTSVPTDHSSVAITTLSLYPLRFASEALRFQLRERGRTFWKCRNRMLVSYVGQYEDERSVR